MSVSRTPCGTGTVRSTGWSGSTLTVSHSSACPPARMLSCAPSRREVVMQPTVSVSPSMRKESAASRVALAVGPMPRVGYQTCVKVFVSPGMM